jgi:glycosyltransferase 2 family protein
LASMMPVSIGGWGLRETAMVYSLGLIGIAPEQALLLSVLIGLLNIVISLPGGVLWLILPSGARGAASKVP